MVVLCHARYIYLRKNAIKDMIQRKKMTSQYKKLDKRRAKLGMSKTAVAARAHVSLPTVNRILAGKETRPTVPNLQAIAKALGVVIRLGETIEIEEPQSAEEFRRQQAHRKATELVRMVQGTMALEAQGVDETLLNQMVEQTKYELLSSRRRLWSES
jgi:transcriptional regulator with XRE-family HTH domain